MNYFSHFTVNSEFVVSYVAIFRRSVKWRTTCSHVLSTCSLSSPLTIFGHSVRLSGWKRSSSLRIRALDDIDWSGAGARRNDRIDSINTEEDVGNGHVGQQAFTGQRDWRRGILECTFEAAEAMSLVHISVYLAQHLWTKLGPPLDEERLLVPPRLPLSSTPPSSAVLGAFHPPWLLSCYCLWCYC